MRNKLFLILGIFPCVVFWGCSGGADFSVEMVEGIVTLDGSPLEGATVGFSPADGTGKPAVGRTDASGKYVLTAMQGGEFGKGTMLGKYKVSITKDKPERELTAQELKKADETGVMPVIPIISIVPKKYTDSSSSDLTAEVVRGRNTFNFALDSNVQ